MAITTSVFGCTGLWLIELFASGKVPIYRPNPLVQYLKNLSYPRRFGEMITAVAGRSLLGKQPDETKSLEIAINAFAPDKTTGLSRAV